MKYAIVIPDGCADEPQTSIGGKTPLQAAATPAMDEIARLGIVGRASNVPDHLPAGSAVANMSLMGYDPEEHFTGRAPLEAAAQGIELAPTDWAIRCNLVTIEDQTMRDFTADHISSEEARPLLASLAADVADQGVTHLEFVPGVSYRNLVLHRGDAPAAPFSTDTLTTPPHDLTDKTVLNDFPRGPGSDLLSDLMDRSLKLFADHPVNDARRKAGKLPATNVWLWGLGQAPQLPSFQSLHGVKGTMITAVDLLRGLASLMGWNRIEVPGATGYTDTDYAAKGRFAIEAIADTDLICVHVEATDEASHEGDLSAKIKGLEEIDRHIVAPLLEALKKSGEYRILVSPDHPTPIRTKTHSHGMVPFAVAGTGIDVGGLNSYDEVAAASSSLEFAAGHHLMKYFIA
jgi:2,3-bisphosphoglycerate-independent phosphoglycerate mutase